MTGSGEHVVVIGGGVIGAACAHYLTQAGRRVTIVERDRFGMACSHGNCGLVCPSHVLPLAEPGAIRGAVASLFRKNAPLAVKPRIDPKLWKWFWNFARRCNQRDRLASGHAIQPLLESSLELYEKLVGDGVLLCEWQKRGLLFVYRTRSAFEGYAETNQLLTETFHEPAERLEADALAELEPALQAGLAGGWLYESDAHLRPDVLMQSWRKRLEESGVAIRENCEVTGVQQSNGTATSLTTADSELTADAFVVATGAWTPKLQQWFGCTIPIQPGKGYSITMQRPTVCPSIPLIFPEHRIAVTPMETGYRLGSVMEFAGYDDSIPEHRVEFLKAGAAHYLQEPYCEPIVERWTGWRPMTYDSQPIIDRSPSLGNVWVAAGHNMLGLSMAPGTGRLVSELITGQSPHVDPSPYSVSRF